MAPDSSHEQEHCAELAADLAEPTSASLRLLLASPLGVICPALWSDGHDYRSIPADGEDDHCENNIGSFIDNTAGVPTAGLLPSQHPAAWLSSANSTHASSKSLVTAAGSVADLSLRVLNMSGDVIAVVETPLPITVSDLHEAIYEQTQIPPERQLLVAGNQWELLTNSAELLTNIDFGEPLAVQLLVDSEPLASDKQLADGNSWG